MAEDHQNGGDCGCQNATITLGPLFYFFGIGDAYALCEPVCAGRVDGHSMKIKNSSWEMPKIQASAAHVR